MVKIIKFLAYNFDNVTQLTQSEMEALKHILIMKIPSSTTQCLDRRDNPSIAWASNTEPIKVYGQEKIYYICERGLHLARFSEIRKIH